MQKTLCLFFSILIIGNAEYVSAKALSSSKTLSDFGEQLDACIEIDKTKKELFIQQENSLKIQKDFEAFVASNTVFYEDIYSYNHFCYEDKSANCGLITNQLSSQATVNNVYKAILSILIYTENISKEY